jgi:hypothetical protein
MDRDKDRHRLIADAEKSRSIMVRATQPQQLPYGCSITATTT